MAKLQCEICGGKLVMQEGGISICESCGMEYTAARIKERIAAELVIGDEEKNRLLKNAETYMFLQNFDAAQSAYKRITEEFPDEPLGWMGLIGSHTNGFTDESKWDEVDVWYRYLEKLTPCEMLSKINGRYLQYVQTCAKGKAKEEMSAIERSIQSNSERIKELSDAFSSSEAERKNSAYKQRKNAEAQARDAKIRLDDTKTSITLWVILCVILGALTIYFITTIVRNFNAFKSFYNSLDDATRAY